MAKQTGIFPFSGRLGNVVGTSKGSFRIFTPPSNPQTYAQQVQRAGYSILSKAIKGASVAMRPFLGASWLALFIANNRDNLTLANGGDPSNPDDYTLDNVNIALDGDGLLGLGEITNPVTTYVGSGDPADNATFGFDFANDIAVPEGDFSYGGLVSYTDDTVMVFLANYDRKRITPLGAVSRSAGTVSFQVSEGLFDPSEGNNVYLIAAATSNLTTGNLNSATTAVQMNLT